MTQKPPTAAGPKIEILDPITWQDHPIPERHWLVADRIPMHNVTGLSGDGGLGKTLPPINLSRLPRGAGGE